MAVGSTTNWAKNTAFDQVVDSIVESCVYRNKEFLGLFPVRPSDGGTAFEWRANSDAASSIEVFTEGAAQPVPDVNDFVKPYLDYIFFRGVTRVTGHMRRALRGGALPAGGFQVIQENAQLLIEDIRDLMATTFMGTSNNGLQLAVDSAGTYAGLDRSSATYWASRENALSGALTHAALMNKREALRDNDRGFPMTGLIMPWNQVTNLQSLPGAPGAANNSIQINLTESGGSMQLAPTLAGTVFGEARVYGVADLTDTVIIGGDMSKLFYVDHGGVEVREWMSGNDDVAEVSMAGTLVCSNPKAFSKETGVTA